MYPSLLFNKGACLQSPWVWIIASKFSHSLTRGIRSSEIPARAPETSGPQHWWTPTWALPLGWFLISSFVSSFFLYCWLTCCPDPSLDSLEVLFHLPWLFSVSWPLFTFLFSSPKWWVLGSFSLFVFSFFSRICFVFRTHSVYFWSTQCFHIRVEYLGNGFKNWPSNQSFLSRDIVWAFEPLEVPDKALTFGSKHTLFFSSGPVFTRAPKTLSWLTSFAQGDSLGLTERLFVLWEGSDSPVGVWTVSFYLPFSLLYKPVTWLPDKSH